MNDLLRRAQTLAGLTVRELAERAGLGLPASLARSKGFIGRAVEVALALPARHGPGPDLPGLEIKTLPVERTAAAIRTAESTFVCTVPRDGLELPWERSAPCIKLARVLFVPIEARGDASTRRVGTPFLWTPSDADSARLSADWATLTGELLLRGHEHVSARLGVALQVRPKAANRESRSLARDETGALSRALPRAFYLRRSFTTELLLRTGLG